MIWAGTWATDKLMEYFYQVDPEYATATRSVYDARPGFLGEELTAVFVQPVAKDWAVYLGASHNFYSESANRDSPLFKATESQSFFIGVTWSSIKSVREAQVAEQ